MATTLIPKLWRPAVTACIAVVVSACGGGGGGGGPAPQPGPSNVTISGTVTYDFVPGFAFGGLNYGLTEARPAREVTVQFVSGTTVLATARTDAAGNYSISVPASRTGFIRARAESFRSGAPSWNLRVVDNVNGNVVYAIDGAAQSSGTTNSRRDLHAASGWTGASYGQERAAAPFAILDTIYRGVQFVVDAGVNNLPPLDVHWSTQNVAALGPNGETDASTGEIGTSFYFVSPARGLNGIYLLGDEDSDTEEYDAHVILHEFAHYLEWQLGRIESIGGPHGRGDRLDMRVAFSEGWATAFAALVLDDPVFVDAGGVRQAGSFSFDVEGAIFPNPAPGWYSEESIWELIYDFADADMDGNDVLSYPFTDLWDIMNGQIVTTPAAVSIFPFLNALRDSHPGDLALIDQLAAEQSIGVIATDFGIGESNDAGSVDVLPVYSELTVNGPAVNVCSTDEFSSPFTGSINKLSSRRFLRFTPPFAGQVTIRATATEIPAGEFADPDWILHRFGPIAISEQPPSIACEAVASGGGNVSDCVEPPNPGGGVVSVINADYVLEIYEWTNTQDADLTPDFAPIGRTCFDVTVTQP